MNSSTKNQEVQAVLNGFFQSIAGQSAYAAASFFADNADWYISGSDLLPETGK